MRYVTNQPYYLSGFSTLSLFVILFLVAAGSMLGYKTLPYYLDHYRLEQAIKEVTKTENIAEYRSAQILEELKKAVKRNAGVSNKLPNIADVAYLSSNAGGRVLGVDYEVVVPIIANMSLSLSFSSEQDLGKASVSQN